GRSWACPRIRISTARSPRSGGGCRARATASGSCGTIRSGSSALETDMTTTHARRSAPVRVALAGAGMISWYHLVAWRNVSPRARVVAVCDPDPARARARAQEFDIPQVYQDAGAMFDHEKIDALDVASPRETHAAWVDRAADRGVDVLCQKPLTPTLAD